METERATCGLWREETRERGDADRCGGPWATARLHFWLEAHGPMTLSGNPGDLGLGSSLTWGALATRALGSMWEP